MKRTRSLLLPILLFLLTIAGSSDLANAQSVRKNWAERFPSKMTPGLEEAMKKLSPDDTLDVYVVMKERLAPEAVRATVRHTPLKNRHRVVSEALRSFAEASQKGVRDLVADETVRVLWLSNALRFEGTKEGILKVIRLPEVGYAGLIRTFPLHTYQDAAVPTRKGFSFYDGFESGAFGPEWTTSVANAGRIQVTGNHGPMDHYHATMDSAVNGVYGSCSMDLTLDLSGITNCYLEFLFKEFDDDLHPEDKVCISADGVTFYPVFTLDSDEYYKRFFIDLDEEAMKFGISLTDTFTIRFSWRDDNPIPSDGFAFDDIRVEEGDPPLSPPGLNLVKLQAPQCWDAGFTGQGVVILNIDSGVDYHHPDLRDQIWYNPGEAPYGLNGVDDDLNGYVDDIMGWDFQDDDNNPYPYDYHGTATGGIVSGDGTDGKKTGMAPGAKQAIAKISGQFHYWEAQQYAVLIGARVITSSNSFKWGLHDPDYHLFRVHCDMELAAGIIHANSISNNGNSPLMYPVPFNISTPGDCPGPWVHPSQVDGGRSSVMACSGVYIDNALYTDSGKGPCAWEDLKIYDPLYPYLQHPEYWDYPYGGFGGGLPGLLKPDVCAHTYVTTTNMGGGYLKNFPGTSASTPHLGGAMCLLVSGNPHGLPRKISQALQETALDLGFVGKDIRFGAGKIQVYDALRRLIHNVQFSDPEPGLGDATELEVSGIPGEFFVLFYSLSKGSTTLPGVGTLELGQPAVVLLYGAVPPSSALVLPLTIPNDPGLVGLELFLQGIMDDRKGTTQEFLFSLVEALRIQP